MGSKYDILLDADEWEHKVFKNKHEEINDWLRSKESTGSAKSRRTLNEYSRTAARFFHEWFPDTAPSDVTVGDIETYVLDLNDRGVAQNTKRRYIESLSSFFKWAMTRPQFEDITGNPAAVVLEEIPRKQPPRPETATWENGKKIVWNIPDPRDKTVAVVMAKTGARVREVLTLRWGDVDLDDGVVWFRDRKGGAETEFPVDDETVTALRRLQAINRVDADDADAWVFTSLKGGRIKRERIRREVKRAAVRAGIMDDVGETRWHYKFVPHYYRTIWTTLMRNSEPGMKDHWVDYLRGDSGDKSSDWYTHRPPVEKVREQYVEVMKPLNL